MSRTTTRAAAALAATFALLATALGSLPARADEVPGQEGRVTHQTLLTTRESDCFELFLGRRASTAAVRPLVPARYEPLVVAADATGIALWDYSCAVAVDGQSRSVRTRVSIGAVALQARDGLPVTGAYYLLWISTDNAVLAARYRQLGLPSEFTPGSTASATDPAATPFTMAFRVTGTNAHVASMQTAAAPVPVPASGGPVVYREGPSTGEVALQYLNEELGALPGLLTADLSTETSLVPLVYAPASLVVNGVRVGSAARGSWSATVSHLG